LTAFGPKVSLIICTRNRAEILYRCLEAVKVAAGKLESFTVEVIVVDNGSVDRTRKVVAEWAQDAQLQVFLVSELKPGLGAARNAGLAAAKAQILAFTDDDCLVDENYFLDILAYFEKTEKLSIVGGRVELGDPIDIPYTIKTDRAENDFDLETCYPGIFLLGANMALHADIIRTVGKFDERFGAGSPFRAAEETDFIFRAALAGISVKYTPTFFVYHFHGRKTKKLVRRLCYGYAIANGALYMKYYKLAGGNILFRYFFQHLRSAAHEIIRGKSLLESELGISYSLIVTGNIHGMILYLYDTGISYFFRREK
jgi:glycosyltransferase involved in cell wall biosynthesis